jgi:hypothetical protein
MDDFKSYILSSRIANEKGADFYVHWVTGFYSGTGIAQKTRMIR